MPGYKEDLDKRELDLEKAKKLLDEADWKMGDDGIRHKKNDTLVINLTTSDWEELAQTAEILKNQWEKIGAQVNIETLSFSDIQQNHIRPREYDAILYGQVMGGDPDLYSFWHSTEKKDPGLNLASFGTSETDRLIEDGRMEFDPEKRAEKYKDFQEKLNEEVPAIFLYSPDYIMIASQKVHTDNIKNLVLPSERFSNISKWFVKTKRIWKK
jgi:peptide/nickel transport system substrate-binding protein